MLSSGILHCVALVRTNVSEECSASIIRVTIIGELGTTLPVTSNIVFLHSVFQLLVMADIPSSPILVTLMMEVLHYSETSDLTRFTWHNIAEDGILHSEFKFYFLLGKFLICIWPGAYTHVCSAFYVLYTFAYLSHY
jgi:hypothetical protein